MARNAKEIVGIPPAYQGKAQPLGVALPTPYIAFLERIVSASGEFDSVSHLIRCAVGAAFPAPENPADEAEYLRQLKAEADARFEAEMADLQVQNQGSTNGVMAARLAADVRRPTGNSATHKNRGRATDPPIIENTSEENYGEIIFDAEEGKELRVIWEQDRTSLKLIVQNENGEELKSNEWKKNSVSPTREFILNQAKAFSDFWRNDLDIREVGAFCQSIVQAFEAMRKYAE